MAIGAAAGLSPSDTLAYARLVMDVIAQLDRRGGTRALVDIGHPCLPDRGLDKSSTERVEERAGR
jgi:hypothetical protein